MTYGNNKNSHKYLQADEQFQADSYVEEVKEKQQILYTLQSDIKGLESLCKVLKSKSFNNAKI